MNLAQKALVLPINLFNFAGLIHVHTIDLNDFEMYLTTEKKEELFATYGKDKNDTGSAEGQVALFTHRINHLTEHLKRNRKDYATERTLVLLVGKRKRILNYLKNKDIERYRAIISKLGLRK